LEWCDRLCSFDEYNWPPQGGPSESELRQAFDEIRQANGGQQAGLDVLALK
jgi:hypothetical protein